MEDDVIKSRETAYVRMDTMELNVKYSISADASRKKMRFVLGV